MADEKTVVPFNSTYEAVVSFIPRERAILRVNASSEELAKSIIRDMAGDNVSDLKIEDIRVIEADDPVPEGYEQEPSETADVEPKKVH
jgi:hypothetical protein